MGVGYWPIRYTPLGCHAGLIRCPAAAGAKLCLPVFRWLWYANGSEQNCRSL